MALLSLLLSFFYIQTLTITLTLTHSTSPPSRLVQKTCNSTTYPDLCLSALAGAADSRSADVRGLSAIIINLAIANATNTSSYALSLAANTTDATVKTLLVSCSAKYSDAGDALRWSVEALATESYDYAFVHVSAAAEYPNVCSALFRRQPKAAYPPEMATRGVTFERLCTIALEIISLLG